MKKGRILLVGMFVSSKAGHDKDTIYIIIKEIDEYVYLVDGKFKTLEKPKRKNKKHIQIIDKVQNEIIRHKIVNTLPIQNEEIKRAIKLYSKL